MYIFQRFIKSQCGFSNAGAGYSFYLLFTAGETLRIQNTVLKPHTPKQLLGLGGRAWGVEGGGMQMAVH